MGLKLVEILNEAQFIASRDYLNSIDPNKANRYWLGLSYQSPSGSLIWISSQNAVTFSNWDSKNNFSVISWTCVRTRADFNRTWLMTDCSLNLDLYAFCQGTEGIRLLHIVF